MRRAVRTSRCSRWRSDPCCLLWRETLRRRLTAFSSYKLELRSRQKRNRLKEKEVSESRLIRVGWLCSSSRRRSNRWRPARGARLAVKIGTLVRSALTPSPPSRSSIASRATRSCCHAITACARAAPTPPTTCAPRASSRRSPRNSSRVPFVVAPWTAPPRCRTTRPSSAPLHAPARRMWLLSMGSMSPARRGAGLATGSASLSVVCHHFCSGRATDYRAQAAALREAYR